jgi:hypothetical protein
MGEDLTERCQKMGRYWSSPGMRTERYVEERRIGLGEMYEEVPEFLLNTTGNRDEQSKR